MRNDTASSDGRRLVVQLPGQDERQLPGLHCETTALGVLLRHEGIELSEPMCFGLGEGLGFLYWDSKAMDFPFLAGRSKPMAIVTTSAARLGVQLQVEQTTSARTAWQNVVSVLQAGRPVGLQLDSHHLKYFTSKVHFGGHVVAMYGYDETHAFLVDTAQQGGLVSTTLDSLARARGQRGPMSAKNLSFTLVRQNAELPAVGVLVRDAVRSNAHAFLNPPIANLGHRGIRKAAAQVRTWLDRGGDPRPRIAVAASLMERGGTGGALFRAVYRDFLGEGARLTGEDELHHGHELFDQIVPLWMQVSQHLAAAAGDGETRHLDDASTVLLELADRERDAMVVLGSLR